MIKVKFYKKRLEELREIERKAQMRFPFDDDEKEWNGELIHSTYDQLADGSRVKKVDKAVDPETANSIRRAFGISPIESCLSDLKKAKAIKKIFGG